MAQGSFQPSNMNVPSHQQDEGANNRQFVRRAGDDCVSFVGERMYPVVNWSQGGILIDGDERMFGIGQTYPVLMKFRLGEEIAQVGHNAQVVRKGGDKIALQFDPLPSDIRGKFQYVIKHATLDNTARRPVS